MLSSNLKNVSTAIARLPKQTIVITSDLALTVLSFWYVLYINNEVQEGLLATDLMQNAYMLTVQALCYFTFGLYRGVWRFASLPDLIRIIKACITGTMILFISDTFFDFCQFTPHFSFSFFCLLSIGLLGGSRLLYRWCKDNRKLFISGQRLIVIGAGTAGDSLLRELKRKTYRDYLPVGLIDDDPAKLGQEIQGIRVLGNVDQLDAIVKKKNIELILIALPKANAAEMRRVVNICEKTQIPYRTLPSLNDIARGQANITHIRPVSVEDLLSRDPVQFDHGVLHEFIKNKKILITGAGGSIGSELCRKIADLQPAEVILIDHSEFNLFQIQTELTHKYPELTLLHYLVSITQDDAINNIMQFHQPHYVFHAAAYKHVPLLEPQVKVAIYNNVFGSEIVATAALKSGVERFILVSTDKAVNPANIMGATKRTAEMLCQALNTEQKTRFTTVRFGNVLGSTGSVVPLFKQQIANGGPVTVTHPDMERYFMTIQEAAQLIIQTLTIKNPNDLYVLDMGEPVKIQYLAEQMIKLSGRKPHVDIPITYSGLRPGEKINEELFYSKESIAFKEQEKILCVKAPPIDVNHFMEKLFAMRMAYDIKDDAAMKKMLFDLVQG